MSARLCALLKTGVLARGPHVAISTWPEPADKNQRRRGHSEGTSTQPPTTQPAAPITAVIYEMVR